MLPIRDKNPSGITPWIVYLLIAANSLVFFLEIGLPQESLDLLVSRFGLVPLEVSRAFRGEASFFTAALIPAFSSMFLHGGLFHLVGNMWYLLIFGDNVEARLGRLGFLVFYLLCGLAATAVHYVLSPQSPLPTIGASGAIAGVLGAYLVCWPRARVLTLVPLFCFISFIELPAMWVLGLWFLVQLLQGTASLGVEFAHGGVAYWAHVGGFAAGIVLIALFPRTGKRRQGR